MFMLERNELRKSKTEFSSTFFPHIFFCPLPSYTMILWIVEFCQEDEESPENFQTQDTH